jgi:GT2 family glycosyltransferase
VREGTASIPSFDIKQQAILFEVVDMTSSRSDSGETVANPRRVSIVIVTYDSGRFIDSCLESIASQTYAPMEILVIDNGSSDDSVERVRKSGIAHRLIENKDNRGFAAAHNQGIRSSVGEYYLALNPDVVAKTDFVGNLVAAMESGPTVGSVTGKLIRPQKDEGAAIIDSTGIYMTPSLRHLDRGSGERDIGQYEEPQYVFGVSGAAALYRRQMLEEIVVGREYFDEDFFSYREDADLAWRAQLLGWKAIYVPTAVATHERRVLPERRKSLPPDINMHSVKNRFLLRIKNQTLLEFVVLLLPSLARDLQVIGYVVLAERSSLPGLFFVLSHFSRIWSKRRHIMARRLAGSGRMLRWFRYRPVAFNFGLSE